MFPIFFHLNFNLINNKNYSKLPASNTMEFIDNELKVKFERINRKMEPKVKSFHSLCYFDAVNWGYCINSKGDKSFKSYL